MTARAEKEAWLLHIPSRRQFDKHKKNREARKKKRNNAKHDECNRGNERKQAGLWQNNKNIGAPRQRGNNGSKLAVRNPNSITTQRERMKQRCKHCVDHATNYDGNEPNELTNTKLRHTGAQHI